MRQNTNRFQDKGEADEYLSPLVAERGDYAHSSYLKHGCATPFQINQRYQRGCDCSSSQADSSELPRFLSFPRPGVDSHHHKYNVERRDDIKVFKHKIPQAGGWLSPEEVDIPRTEYGDIQGLSDQRNAYL